MTGFSEYGSLLKAVSLCFLAAACAEEARNPANETPVDPQAGLYEITVSGAGLLKNVKSKDAPKTYCLTQIQSASFPHLLAENFYKLSPLCTVNRAPREGNAVAGEISCAADPKMATGMNRFVYKGAVGEETTSVEVRIKFDAELKPGAGGEEISDAQLKLAMKAMEQARFAITATRTGDCS